MSWSAARAAHLPVAPNAVWAVLADPGRWPQWAPSLARAHLDGPAALGVTGGYVPAHRALGPLHDRTAPALSVTAFEPGRQLEITQPTPLGSMRIEWTLVQQDGGTLLTQTIEVKGVSAPFVVLAVARTLDRDFQLAPARLARLAGWTPDRRLPRVVIAGGSGSLGRLLAARLSARGHDVRILTRSHDPGLPFDQVLWDGRTTGAWTRVLEDEADGPGVALVNLAGRLVDVRPTAANIAGLRDSRVDSTRALVAASATLHRPLVAWLQASTTAIWSDAGELRLTEDSPLPDPGLPQMTGVARAWEEATRGALTDHLVLLRTSIVLDRDAPALKVLARLTRAGLGGRVGTGRQWFSWIHHEDWLRVSVAALGLDPQLRLPAGPLVAAAPHPVRNAELMAALRRHLHRPPAPPTPTVLLRLGAVALRSDPALALTGRHCTSSVLAAAGFTFDHPDLASALREILG